MFGILILALQSSAEAPQVRVDTRQEIVVTGERVSRSEHETASSIALFDADRMDTLAAPDRVEQLLELTPNIQIGSGGEGPVIRGQDSTGVVRDLPAFLAGTRPRATIRVDGRSASYYELAFGLTSLWDVDRVEIFRTPQTTTQGRNSIGGAIFVETKEPEFDWLGRARLISGQARTRQISLAVSGPLIDDQLAFRISGDLRRSRTDSDITTGAIGVDPNRDDSDLVRVKLRATPRALADTRIDIAYAHGRSQAPQFEGIEPPYRERRNPSATYGVWQIEVDTLTAAIRYDPTGGPNVVTTMSYGQADMRRRAPTGLGEVSIDARDFSIEPIVSLSGTGGRRYLFGINYTRSTLDQTIDLTTLPSIRGNGAFDDVQHSFGAFGEVTIPLSPKLVLTSGLRYQIDRQRRTGALIGRNINLPLTYDERFSEWLPKFSLAWDINSDVRLGVLAQRASNPGGVNLSIVGARVDPFGGESLWDYELYARTRLDDGKLTVAANLFHYAMVDAQRTQTNFFAQPIGPPIISTEVGNAPRAWTKGLELDVDWRPSRFVQGRFAIGLLDTRITRTVDPSDPLRGKEFQRSPHFSGTAMLVWNPIRSLTLSTQVRHRSRYFSDDLETAARRVPAATIVDARVELARGRQRLFAYARNALDTFNFTYRFSNGFVTATEARQIGFGIDMRF